jgi:hypothetical protein
VPNIIQPIQSGVQSVATAVATAVPGVVSTAISDLSSIEASIPQYVSLGTKKFCVGFANKPPPPCTELPLNLSTLIPTIPADVESYLHLDVNVVVQRLNSALAKITPVDIYDCLISGLALTLVTVVVACSMSLPMMSLLAIPGFKMLKVGLPLLLGILSCTFLMISTVILGIVDAKTNQLPSLIQVDPSLIQVDHGEVSKLSHWGLSCAILAAIATTISAIVL